MNLLQMSFSGAAFITAVVIIRAVAINKLPKKTFLVLWELVILRLLIPFSIPSMFSVYTLVTHSISSTTLPEAGTDYNIPTMQGLFVTSQGAEQPPENILSSVSMWFIVWCAGIILIALFFVISYLRCLIEFRTALPVHNHYVEKWLAERPLKRPILVKQSDRISAPLTYGIFRPVILVPKKMDWKNEKQLQYVLSHEYVHIYRYDTVTKLIATLALCIHWFNPFVWVMYILFNRDIELACDESVIRQFGEKSKSAYSLMLINMEATKSGLLPFCNSFSKNAIEERITAIMKTKKTTIFSLVLACLIVVGVATAFATSAQANNNPIFEEQEYKPIHASENASDYDTAAELPGGNIDYGIYEEYGLIYDKNSKCYTYKGNVVRFFNDPVGGASFTNFFTGTVDIEAERDTNDKLIGIRECTKEVYDRHTEKYENSGLKSMPAGTSTENGDMIRNHESYSMESGDKTENMNTLQDYESYGIVYHPKDGYWYYNDQIIGIFIDTKKPIIYFNNSGSIYLSIAENSENGVMEIKEISEAEAQKLLRDNNSGNSASFTVETLK